MPKFQITYEVVTPESAEHGDFAEIGFVTPGGFQHSIESDGAMDAARNNEFAFDLRSAVRTLGCVENAGRWFVEADGRDNYRDGSNTRYSLHPPQNITPSSYGRLCRLLKA
jgi:hypothetical protein